MSLNRAQIDAGGNSVRAQGPGDALMSQRQPVAITTVGAGVWTAVAIAAGIIDRSGPVAGYADTPDTADNILAACPYLSVGDSFEFYVRNTVAQTNTVAVSEGVSLVANTTIAASKVRKYLMTVLSNMRRQIFSGTTVNASPIISGFTASQLQLLQPGMGVSGTGITGGSYIIASNPNSGTITLDQNATASGTVALTFFPRMTLKGLSSADL